jgi:hypothetical protein
MNATTSLDRYPAGLPLTADQITEFHAARILLLLHLCGVKNRIVGLTKLAKLDFFVRYPEFFQRAAKHLEQEAEQPVVAAVESMMIRLHYGPWDARYYQIIAYLESRELITVERQGKAFVFSLTKNGAMIASRLDDEQSYRGLSDHMGKVKELLGNKSGDVLKKLVYELFDEEIAKLPLGQVIQP